MIQAEVRKHKGNYISFESKGHAGYAEENYDIVCAAVSVLVINTVNSLEQFTSDRFEAEDADGYVSIRFMEDNSPEAKLLMDSLILGLTEVKNSLNSEKGPNSKKKPDNRYLKLNIREV